MHKFHSYDKILSPIVTEKSTNMSDQNKIVFKVPNSTNKEIIKKNIEKIFKVKVIKINTINKKPKTKTVRGKLGFKKGFKKAVVTLKKGQTIDLSTGV